MGTLRRRTLELIVRDDGPTAVEYAVLLALIAVAALTAMATFGQRVDAIYAAIRGVMETV
jgi:pilus assembly protein Flp/PilA